MRPDLGLVIKLLAVCVLTATACGSGADSSGGLAALVDAAEVTTTTVAPTTMSTVMAAEPTTTTVPAVVTIPRDQARFTEQDRVEWEEKWGTDWGAASFAADMLGGVDDQLPASWDLVARHRAPGGPVFTCPSMDNHLAPDAIAINRYRSGASELTAGVRVFAGQSGPIEIMNSFATYADCLIRQHVEYVGGVRGEWWRTTYALDAFSAVTEFGRRDGTTGYYGYGFVWRNDTVVTLEFETDHDPSLILTELTEGTLTHLIDTLPGPDDY